MKTGDGFFSESLILGVEHVLELRPWQIFKRFPSTSAVEVEARSAIL